MSKLSPPNPREPLVDQFGMVRPYWMRLLNDLFIRVGGPAASTNEEISIDMPEDSGLAELTHSFFTADDAANQVPSRELRDYAFEDSAGQQPQMQPQQYEQFIESQVRALSEQVAALSKQVEELKQGTTL